MDFSVKSYIKIGAVVLFIIICITVGIKYGMEISYRNEMNEIYASKDTSLDNYKRNKGLVESYLQVYDIVDENSYQSVKNDLYNKLSVDMQKEIFPTVNYTGLALHDLEYYVVRILGTNNSNEEINTFLIEYDLLGVNYEQRITNLIEIKDNTIMKVTRIK